MRGIHGLDGSILKQIRNLLRKTHSPRVRVEASCIPGAGKGVYSNQQVSADQLPFVTCLYPGVYTPGLPLHVTGTTIVEYLASTMPPSGIHVERNAYILNLQRCGGYVDGCALKSTTSSGPAKEPPRTLDANPSACGHLVNHDSCHANVEVFSFTWGEVLPSPDSSDGKLDEDCFDIPNASRRDGSIWYYNGHDGEIVRFPLADQQPTPVALCGAAMVLTCPIKRGDELLLDYGLRPPYPDWASGWYSA